MGELLVVINGEIHRLKRRYHVAFERSVQQVGTNNRWRIETKDADPLTPGDKVGYLDQIWVFLAPGPNDGGDVRETPTEHHLNPIAQR